MIILPISSVRIDWEVLIHTINDQLGRSPTRLIDSAQLNLSEYAAYLATLGEFSCLTPPYQSLRHNLPLQRHLFYSFICTIQPDSYVPLIRDSELSTLSQGGVTIISGTLDQWRAAILHFCGPTIQSTELRYLFDNLYLYFVGIGLTDCFFGYNKSKSLDDGTFMLEYTP